MRKDSLIVLLELTLEVLREDGWLLLGFGEGPDRLVGVHDDVLLLSELTLVRKLTGKRKRVTLDR